MAMKLEVIITHDETNNKCSVEWTTASTQQVTRQEEQTLSLVKKRCYFNWVTQRHRLLSINVTCHERGKTNAKTRAPKRPRSQNHPTRWLARVCFNG